MAEDAIDEVMLVATFDTPAACRDAVSAAYSAGRFDASDGLNAPCNDADAVILRQHIRRAHPSLLDPVADGPLPENLDEVPNDVLAAIHTANHLRPWSQHNIDDWKA